jgi:hypothetical protein
MPLLEKRIIVRPPRLGQRKLDFKVKDLVRARVGNTIVFRNATIIAIAGTYMTIQYEGCPETIDLPLASIKQHGPDGEFANGLSGLGGCSSSSSSRSRAGKRSRAAKKLVDPAELHDWAVTVITRVFVASNTVVPTSVLSRTFMVYDSSMLIDGEWVPQDEESINMLEAFNDPILGDMWMCAHHSFLRDLFLSTPCEDLKVRMLGSLEPMCLGETVEEEEATVEEQESLRNVVTGRFQSTPSVPKLLPGPTREGSKKVGCL